MSLSPRFAKHVSTYQLGKREDTGSIDRLLRGRFGGGTIAAEVVEWLLLFSMKEKVDRHAPNIKQVSTARGTVLAHVVSIYAE